MCPVKEHPVNVRIKSQPVLLRSSHPAKEAHASASGKQAIFRRWRVIAGRIVRACTAVNCWLQDYYRLCGRTGFDLPNNDPRNVFLRPDEVLRLTPENRISRITIVRGTIWLTASPANGDVLLSAGENFSLEGNWPFVVQALGEAAVILVPGSG